MEQDSYFDSTFAVQTNKLMRTLIYLLIVSAILPACHTASEKAKNAIKGGGEIVGKTVGEFGKGISEGIEETFETEVSLSELHKGQGLELGKISLESDSGGTDNILVIYMIFNKDFKERVTAKVFDMNDLEMGRASLDIAGKMGDAKFFEFHFNQRTNIDSDSKITLE